VGLDLFHVLSKRLLYFSESSDDEQTQGDEPTALIEYFNETNNWPLPPEWIGYYRRAQALSLPWADFINAMQNAYPGKDGSFLGDYNRPDVMGLLVTRVCQPSAT
jgi:hypothetical protein